MTVTVPLFSNIRVCNNLWYVNIDMNILVFLLFSERTEKLPMNSIKAVVSEPLDGHEEYHMLVNIILH